MRPLLPGRRQLGRVLRGAGYPRRATGARGASQATYNAAPTQIHPVVRLNEVTRTREMVPMQWGLVPTRWTKPLSEKKFTTINAQSETAHEKPVFRGAFRHKRCLVPISGYYEWSVSGKTRTPFAFKLKNRRWFCVAGLWDAS